jgi:hypothetical protein
MVGVQSVWNAFRKLLIPVSPGKRWAGHVARKGEGRGVYRILVGKPEGKTPLGRSRFRWEDDIKMDILEVEYGVWTGLGWLRIETGGGHL